MRHLFAFTAVIMASMSVFAEPAKESSIRELMEITGAARMGDQIVEQMTNQLRGVMQDVPPSFWDALVEEADAEELIQNAIPIYQKYLTEEDIQTINAFNRTPTGRKLIAVQPQIMQESLLLGQKWGQEVAARAMARAGKTDADATPK